MIIAIRGHIRNAFDNDNLYHLIKHLHIAIPQLIIIIHTWNIIANDLSWRKIQENKTQVTPELITNYFKDIHIEHIIIDNDAVIKHHGNTFGKLNDNLTPKLAWKNYWFAKHKLFHTILSQYPNQPVANFRFDILKNSHSIDPFTIFNFITHHLSIPVEKNIFMFNDENHLGIDNLYIGTATSLTKLADKFVFNLDDILSQNKTVTHHEFLVFRINQTI